MSAPTGGTITYNGNKTIHTFTTNGDFIIPSGMSGNIEVLIVGGGGGGGRSDGASGAGGGGGVVYKSTDAIVAGTFPVVIGAGGAKITSGTSDGNNGEDSTFHGLTAKGGGAGGGGTGSGQTGENGGSGGGGCYGSGAGGTETQSGQSGDSGTYGHGYDGGTGGPQSGAHGTGGGGGAGEAGAVGTASVGGDGGDGYQCSITGSSVYYAGGGGGGVQSSSYTGGTGGQGGGGTGDHQDGNSGTPNTGGGGSGGGPNGSGYSGASGGSGIVIISYITADFTGFGITDTLTMSDSWTMGVPVFYPTEIISVGNYLYSVTYTNPAQIVKTDISTPSNPSKAVYDIVGQSSAVNFSYNSSNESFYVECADGKVIKIALSNLNTQTIISTGETEDFVIGESLSTYLKTFASTDNSSGEIIMIDEATIESLNVDARWARENTDVISCRANTILGETVNCDVRYAKETTSSVTMDVRWLEYEYDDISNYPINYSNIQVIVNSTDISNTGVDMKSINITHTKGADSVASFILYRKHDDPDNGCEITNNNSVVININGVEEFNGNINNFVANSQSETIEISAVMDEPDDSRQTVSIPLSTIGTHLHLYDCLIDTVSNNNKVNFFEGSEDTRVVLVNSSGLYYVQGRIWTGDITRAYVFDSFLQANSIVGLEGGHLEDLTSQDAWAINYKEPSYYKGIAVNLGTGVYNHGLILDSQIHSELFYDIHKSKSLAEQLKNGTFTPEQNWEYFWFAEFQYFSFPRQEDIPYGYFNASISGLKYIGTSLGSLTTDIWDITNVKYIKQRRYGDRFYDLGWYYAGDAPYKIVSVKNGLKHLSQHYEDRDDGLYDVYSESYNYTQYAKDVADLEYSKLKNINDEVLPRVSSTVNLTLNGYYYYGVKLLTRVNLSNTTSSDVYNNNNGFPVSIKSININTSTMQVSLQCDNELSKEEMEEIDRLYPDENSDEYYTPESAFCNDKRKYDPNKWGYIE